jgi:hypothetical protein
LIILIYVSKIEKYDINHRQKGDISLFSGKKQNDTGGYEWEQLWWMLSRTPGGQEP